MTTAVRSNFAQILESAAEIAPDRPAILEGGRSCTYVELHRRAGSYAAGLQNSGVGPGDRVGILVERGAEAAAAYFGTLALGSVPVLINEAVRRRQVAYALEKTAASVLITRAGTAGLGRLSAPAGFPLLSTDEFPDYPGSPALPRGPDDLAQIVFTSGSSGMPKGVMLSHGNLSEAVRAVTAYLELDEHDRTISLLPFSSVFGLNQLICSVASASTLIIERSPLASRIWETVERESVTVLAAVPPLWHQLIPSLPEGAARASLRILQNAGGHLAEGVVRQIRGQIPRARLFLMYGMTEVIRSTYLPPSEVDRRPGSIGGPIPGARVQVLRDDGSECDAGEVGELVHMGPTTALGYWNDADTTDRLFLGPVLAGAEGASAGRGFRSGDLVRKDEEGFLYYVGRRDRVMKSMGHRVGPDEVADALIGSGEVTEAVAGSEPAKGGTGIVAYVVLAPEGSLDRLRDYCRREMPRYMQPERIEVLRSIPLLPGGKYDLNRLMRCSQRKRPGCRSSPVGAREPHETGTGGAPVITEESSRWCGRDPDRPPGILALPGARRDFHLPRP